MVVLPLKDIHLNLIFFIIFYGLNVTFIVYPRTKTYEMLRSKYILHIL